MNFLSCDILNLNCPVKNLDVMLVAQVRNPGVQIADPQFPDGWAEASDRVSVSQEPIKSAVLPFYPLNINR